jgi:hypothetical protein
VESKTRPLFVGLRAAKANFIPGLIIQAAMVACVLGYYRCTPFRDLLTNVAELKLRGGYFFSFCVGALGGGVFPEILNVLLFQKGRVNQQNWRNLCFACLFWGVNALAVDKLYRLQAWFFGPQVDFPTVTKKVLVDQFIYNVIFAAPFGVSAYEWRAQRFRLTGMSKIFTPRFYGEKILPSLIATWGVWIPLVSTIYALPPLVQIPLFTLALTFWVIIFTWINRPQQRAQPEPVQAIAG